MITKDKIALLRSLLNRVTLPLEINKFGSLVDQNYTLAYDMGDELGELFVEALNALPELLEVYEMYEDLCR